MTRCQALNISNKRPCLGQATSVNGLFCHFHSQQAQGLYRGYKTRNFRLDELDSKPPAFLAQSNVQLPSQNFEDVEDAATLHELHEYLLRKQSLLQQIIQARKLHHSHFFPVRLDYGHEAYIDQLTNKELITVHALKQLERRTAEVVHAQQRWYDWVKETQDREETERESEKKTIQTEAALHKRHWKELQARLSAAKKKEDLEKQDDFLREVYLERTSKDDGLTWDPIEDAVGDERNMLLSIIGSLLWHEDLSPDTTSEQLDALINESPSPNNKDAEQVPVEISPKITRSDGTLLSKNARKKARQAENRARKAAAAPAVDALKVNVSKETLRDRLLNTLSYDTEQETGDTMTNTIKTTGKVARVPAVVVDRLIEGLSEIRTLLFCRLLLSQASLLAPALRAESVSEFLDDPSVSTMDLRNVCIRLYNADPQAIRDACADRSRVNEPAVDDDDEGDPDEDTEKSKQRQVKIRVCGRTIWN